MGKTNAQLGSEVAHEVTQALHNIAQAPDINKRCLDVSRLAGVVEKLGKRFDTEIRRERERTKQQDNKFVDRLFAAAALHRVAKPDLTPREAVIEAHALLAETEEFMECR